MSIDNERAALRTAGRATRASLGLPAGMHAGGAPGFSELFDELVLGALWNRPGLDLGDRVVATLATLAALERRPMLAAYASAAGNAGVDAAAVREIVLQAGLYTGFVAAEENLAAVNAELGAPGSGPHSPAADADLLALGTAIMDELHGARARSGYASGEGAPAALYDLAIRYGYGLLWNRPGLTRRQRFITTVAVFTALEQPVQLSKFSASAMENGLEFDAITAIVMHVAPYCGFPRALNALSALDALKK